MLSDKDVVGRVAAVAQLPPAIDESNISRAWWRTQNVFLLFTMAGATMGYHLDLWATAVLYVVLWGAKVFVLAPPTHLNLKLFRAWQVVRPVPLDSR